MSRHAFEQPFGGNRAPDQRKGLVIGSGAAIALTPEAGVGWSGGSLGITVSAAADTPAIADDAEFGTADVSAILTSAPIAKHRIGRCECLLVAVNLDSSVTLALSDPANEVLVVGNPVSGAVVVAEIPPIAGHKSGGASEESRDRLESGPGRRLLANEAKPEAGLGWNDLA